jgi:hypothetical protein
MTWNKWVAIGKALSAGRTYCMRVANTNQPKGRHYNEIFSAWLKQYQFTNIEQAARKRLFDCVDHLDEIEIWRQRLSPDERVRYNHPTTVLRKWQASFAVVDPDVPGKASAVAKLKESVRVLSEENHRLKQAADSGSLFDLRKDTINDIARVIVSNVSESRADEIARAIRRAVKAKQKHAG